MSLKQLFAGAIGTGAIPRVDPAVRARAHPNLVRQLEVFDGPAPGGGSDATEDHVTYVASVWVPGATLAAAAEDAPVEQLLRWVRQVAGALDYLHAPLDGLGPVVHRDVKPSNIVVTPAGEALLIDLGLARPTALGATGTPHGSPGFVPPECRRDPASSGPAGDRWQLAASLVAVLTGDAPRGTDAVERQRLRRALQHKGAPGSLAPAIEAMLADDPACRPPIATDWAVGLERVLAAATSRRRLRPTAAATMVAALAFGAVSAAGLDALRSGSRASAVPALAASVSREITVYNEVTNGATTMREDTPAYLSTAPANFCKRDGCAIAGTDMGTGATATATCQTVAALTTNGDNTTLIDQHNPERWTSDRWYGIRLPDGVFGYLSEVWVAPDDRGGLGLRQC